MKTIFSLILIALSLTPCYAQTESDSISLPIGEGWGGALNEVVVTATRTQKTLKDVPVQTRLITAADIQRTDATNIQDLLQTELPGVEFSYAMNQQVNMNLAGFAGQSVLILVDGERLAGETMDNVDFSRLLMSGVARIEIVKGAASALYGSNAAGGVINIITTKAPLSPPLRGEAVSLSSKLNARYGGHGEFRTGGNLKTKGKQWSNSLDVNHYTIDSYNVCSDNTDACDFRTVHGYRTWNFNDRLTFSIGKTNSNLSPYSGGAGGGLSGGAGGGLGGLLLTARAGYYFKERYYNPDTPDRYRDFSAGLRGQWRIDERNDLEVAYSFDQYDKSDFLKASGLDVRDYRNVINSVRGLYNHQFDGGFLLTAGGDFSKDYLDTYQFAEGEAKRQTTADVFSQLDWTLNDHWEVVGAVRYDYFSDSKDSRLTTKLNARYRLGDWTFRTGYAQGFRAPSLKERYMNFDMAGIFDIHGNASLKPETSQNLNLSAEYSWRNYSLTVGGNYTFVDNKISTSAIRYGADGQPYIDYINVEKLRVAGIDATATARWSHGLSAKLSYAYTHEQTVGGSITQYCSARPHSLTTSFTWAYNNLSPHFGGSWRGAVTLSGRFLSEVAYNSMYMYEPFETKRVVNPAYTMWKLQLNQTICDGLHINLTLDNLLNYRPKVYSFNAPTTDGFNLMVGANIDIDQLLP